MSSDFNLLELLAGIGVFLFGMFQLEESLKLLSGKTFKRLIHKFTRNWFRSVITGTISTAILQSGSTVSLMVLAFAGAGLIGMESAIGVMVGSNLGSTFTSWIVATIGFKLNIELLYFPFIAIGGIGIILSSNSPRLQSFCKFLIGLGLLFMGLDFMKSSIEQMTQHYDFTVLQGHSAIVYVLIGLIMTAIVQSTSAAMAIVFATINTGLISFEVAAYFVIGANIGSTITVLIGSLGSQTIKKRVALSHFLFNAVTAVLTIIMFPLLVYFIQKTVALENDLVTAIALFHTLFNFIGVLIFLPLIGFFSRLIIRMIKEKKTTITKYLHTLKPDVSEAGLEALRLEIRHLIIEVIWYHLRLLKLEQQEHFASFIKKETTEHASLSVDEHYQMIKSLEAEIYTFAAGLQTHELNDEEARMLNKLLHSSRNAVASAKILKDVQHNILDVENSDNSEVEKLFQQFKVKWNNMHQQFIDALNQHEASVNIGLLHSLTLTNKEDDLSFTELITKNIASKKIKPSEIPVQIAINRAFNISVRQMIHALRDLLLTEPESDIVEKLSETTDKKQ